MVPAKDSLRVLPAPLDRRKGQEQTQYLQYMIAQLAQEVIGQRGGAKLLHQRVNQRSACITQDSQQIAIKNLEISKLKPDNSIAAVNQDDQNQMNRAMQIAQEGLEQGRYFYCGNGI